MFGLKLLLRAGAGLTLESLPNLSRLPRLNARFIPRCSNFKVGPDSGLSHEDPRQEAEILGRWLTVRLGQCGVNPECLLRRKKLTWLKIQPFHAENISVPILSISSPMCGM